MAKICDHKLLLQAVFSNVLIFKIPAPLDRERYRVHFLAFVNNMAECRNGKNLETQLKKVALASACTLTGPLGFTIESSHRDEGSVVLLTFVVA